jgi:hypothetical protein
MATQTINLSDIDGSTPTAQPSSQAKPQVTPQAQPAAPPAGPRTINLTDIDQQQSAGTDKGAGVTNGDNLGNWSPDQPLTSYGAANRAAIGGLVDDTIDTVKGAVQSFDPRPQSPEEQHVLSSPWGGIGPMYVYRMLHSLAPAARAAIHPSEIAAAIHDINSSQDPTGTYLKIAQKTASQGAGQAVTALATGKAIPKIVGAVGDAIAPTVEGAEGPAVETLADHQATMDARPAEPGIVKQVWQGKKVAQPGAQSAVRSGVQSSTEATGTAGEPLTANIQKQPLVKGHNTFMDEHLSTLKENEGAAYKKMDETAGFDVKAEKQQLANDQYKLNQLGNTDADTTQRGNLIESINDSTDRIVEAEAKMQEAGIDPKSADGIHQQRMAGQDFRKSLIKNTNPADGSVNVDGLLNDAKTLRFGKYGDRLQQFMGKEGADKYVSQLEDMQKLGAHAMKAQKIAVWLGKYVAPEAVGGALATGYALSK